MIETIDIKEKDLEPGIISKIDSSIGESIYVYSPHDSGYSYLGKNEGIKSCNKGYESYIRFYHHLPFFKKPAHKGFSDCLIIDKYLTFHKKYFYGLELMITEEPFPRQLLIEIDEILRWEYSLYIGRDQIIEGMKKHNNSYNINPVDLAEHVINKTK